MVKWAFTNLPELKTSLEFHQTPTIFFSNQFPYEGIPLGVSLGFQLFGGTQCTLYKPCNGLIQLNPDPQKTPYVLISTGVTGAPIFKTGTSLPEARGASAFYSLFLNSIRPSWISLLHKTCAGRARGRSNGGYYSQEPSEMVVGATEGGHSPGILPVA